MDFIKKLAITVILSLSFMSMVHAGSFYFPLEGYYPYSSYLSITAVPDLDQNWNYIKTRMGETGSYWDGCLAFVNGQNVACSSSNTSAPWAYKRPYGALWTLDGVTYDDYASGSGREYMWYDNHRGYDFAESGVNVHAVEDGTTCGYVSSMGQICIEHNLDGTYYRTYYTHMMSIPSTLKNNSGFDHPIARWDFLGVSSNVGTGAAHLHFATYKKVGSN